MQQIYLDYNGSTPIAEAVLAAMTPYLNGCFGNPSSTHWAADEARDAIEKARGQVATLIASDPTEVVFTSGGTEANNLAIKGVFFAKRPAVATPHYIASAIEHPSVLVSLRFLERQGAELTLISVDRYGRINPDDVECALRPNTVLVSVMHANNEVGTIQPIAEIGRICRERGVLLHSDAAQSVGKVAVDVQELQVDLLTIAGHKLYAPKGIGALFVREGIELESLLHGGQQEAGRRAGTESAALIVGLGTACELSRHWVDCGENCELRDHFWNLLREAFGDCIVLNGHPTSRLPNTLNASFLGCEGDALLAYMEGVAASTGSACHAGHVKASPVLTAMGVEPLVATGAIRFSLGRATTRAELEEVVERLRRVVQPGSAAAGPVGALITDCSITADPTPRPLAGMTGDEIMAAVRDRYGQVAEKPREKFNFPVGRAFAESVGYDPALLAKLPEGLSESFTGAGNPQPFVDAKPGDIVLDLGCGVCLDVYHYARGVGPQGKVFALDFSEAMLHKAELSLRAAGVKNVAFLHASADRIPLPDSSIDLVTANGIYNLSPDKDAVMREVARVLKPGGRTVFAEILAKEELPHDLRCNMNDWFRCIGGALTEHKFFERLQSAGLSNPQALWRGRNARTGHPLSICAVIRAECRKG